MSVDECKLRTLVEQFAISQPGKRADILSEMWIATTGCDAHRYDPRKAARVYRLVRPDLRAMIRISLERAISNELDANTRLTMIEMRDCLRHLEFHVISDGSPVDDRLRAISFKTSPRSIFKSDIDGKSVKMPDWFCPVVGDKLRIKIDARAEELWVVERCWISDLAGELQLCLTVASEMPAKPTTRRAHLKR